MSLLSDRDIAAYIRTGSIAITPAYENAIQPASYEVHLDRHFIAFDTHRYGHIDPAVEQPGLTRPVIVPDGSAFMLHPGEFVLASTIEVVALDGTVAAQVNGKSSLGRLGLVVHATAGFIDPGFEGHVTLELSNVATLPIALSPGMKIAQLCFQPMSTPVDAPYGSAAVGSHYQHQRGPVASRSYQRFSIEDAYADEESA